MMFLYLLALFSVASGCTEDALARCRKRMDSTCSATSSDASVCVPTCVQEPQWVRDECCFSCRPGGFDACTSTPLLGAAPTLTSTDTLIKVFDRSNTCDIVACRDGAVPTKTSACCRSCVKVKADCTFVEKLTCSTKVIAECLPEQLPKRGTDCCETCRVPTPKVCNLDKDGWLALRICEDGEVNQLTDDGCPSCVKPVPTEPVCTADTVCRTISTCADGVLPERDPDNACCKTCTPLLYACTPAQVEACRADYESLPDCATLEESTARTNFDTATCCPKCKRPAPLDTTERPDTDGRCTYEAFKKCLSTKDVCASPDEYYVDKISCCGTCQRPERQAPLAQAAKCLAQRPVCSVDQRPVAVTDEDCYSCRKPVPCSRSDCGADEVCYKSECVTKVELRLTLTVTVQQMKDKLAALQGKREELAELFKESLKRYCGNQDAVRQLTCLSVARTLVTLAVKENSITFSEVEGKMTMLLQMAQAKPAAGNRRLLQTGDALGKEGATVGIALQDKDSGIAGVSVSWGGNDLDAAGTALPSVLSLTTLLALALA